MTTQFDPSNLSKMHRTESYPTLLASKGDNEKNKEISKTNKIASTLYSFTKAGYKFPTFFFKKKREEFPSFASPSTPQELNRLLIDAFKEYSNLVDQNVKPKLRICEENQYEKIETHIGKENLCLKKIEALLNSGADINCIVDDDHNTLLHIAAMSGNIVTIKLLLYFKADVTKKNHTVLGEHTPIELVQGPENKNMQVLQILEPFLEHSTNLEKKEPISSSSSSFKENTTNPLHFAAKTGNCLTVKELISKGVDINTKDEEDRTALHYAVLLNKPEIIPLLADNKIDVNIQDQNGETPLHYAVYSNKAFIVTMLLRLGAKPDIKNHENQTPIDLAESAESFFEEYTPSAKEAFWREMFFDPSTYFAKNVLRNGTTAFFSRAFFPMPTSINPILLFGGISSWIITSSLIGTIFRYHYKSAHLPYISRRISSEILAGAIILSYGYASENLALVEEIGKTMIDLYITELLLKKAVFPFISYSKKFFQKTPQKNPLFKVD